MVREDDVMLAAILLFGQAFAYHLEQDPFTDEPTHVARIGDPRKEHVEVICGDSSGWKLTIRIYPKETLEYSSWAYRIGRLQPVRFDDDTPVEMRFHYRDDDVLIVDDDAQRFVDGLLSAERVRFETLDYRRDAKLFDFPTDNARIAVANVRRECLAHKMR